MSGVPADEVRGTVVAGQVDTGDVQRPVGDRTGREDDRVVVPPQVVQLQVDAVGDVADEPDPLVLQHPVQGLDDLFDPRMVRRDAVPDQAERRGEPLDQVHLGGGVLLGHDVGGVDTGWSGTDDGDAEILHNKRSNELGNPNFNERSGGSLTRIEP